MNLLVIIPAFNEANHITTTVQGVLVFHPQVLVIDDGSHDETVILAEQAGAKTIKHDQNRGKGEALKTAFAYASEHGFDTVITLDADGQHDPADIPRFIEHANASQADVILGARTHDRRSMPWLRRATNTFMSRLISGLAGQTIYDTQTGYRLLRMTTIQALTLTGSKYDMESEILVKAARQGFQVQEIPISTIYPENNNSGIHPLRDSLRFFRLYFRLRRNR